MLTKSVDMEVVWVLRCTVWYCPAFQAGILRGPHLCKLLTSLAGWRASAAASAAAARSGRGQSLTHGQPQGSRLDGWRGQGWTGPISHTPQGAGYCCNEKRISWPCSIPSPAHTRAAAETAWYFLSNLDQAKLVVAQPFLVQIIVMAAECTPCQTQRQGAACSEIAGPRIHLCCSLTSMLWAHNLQDQAATCALSLPESHALGEAGREKAALWSIQCKQRLLTHQYLTPWTACSLGDISFLLPSICSFKERRVYCLSHTCLTWCVYISHIL